MSAPESLNPAIAAFMQRLAERNSALATQEHYRRDVQALEHWCQRHQLDLTTLNAQHLRDYLAERRTQGLSARSMQRHLASLRGFFALMYAETPSANPTQHLRAPKRQRPLPKVPDADQTQRLFTHSAHGPLELRDLAMLELLYGSGLRLAELVQLDWTDLDLEQALVRVQGKGGHQRDVPLGSKACAALEQWRPLHAQMAHNDEQAALFVSQRGRRITRRSVQQRLQRWGICSDAGFRLHPHLLRHACASHLLESSGDLRAVQDLLGHANIATTQVYTHLDYQHLAQVYDRAHPRSQRAATHPDADAPHPAPDWPATKTPAR